MTQSNMPQEEELWNCPAVVNPNFNTLIADLLPYWPDLFAILGEYQWIHGNMGADGNLSLRLPRDCAKEISLVIGEMSWGGGACDAWAIIKGITPAVDSSGKEYWGVEFDEWVYENPVGDENESKPPVKGHMLHATNERDDDGNLYLVWTFAGEDWWMIGKKNWNKIKTEGDRRRLRLMGSAAEQDLSNYGIPPLTHVARDVYKEKEGLGLEKLILRNTLPDVESLLGNYRWIYNSADKRPWHPRESWGSDLSLLRNPSGGSKITGRLQFWSDSYDAEMKTTVGAISASVDGEGNGIWSITSRKWFGQGQPRRATRNTVLCKDGHQMRYTVEEDDAGNPFLEVVLCWGFEPNPYGVPPKYSYLIGKKQRSHFGRLGFSAEEYVRLTLAGWGSAQRNM